MITIFHRLPSKWSRIPHNQNFRRGHGSHSFSCRWHLDALSSHRNFAPFSTAPSSLIKRLDVAIVGAPNAGKSQLVNKITNTTVSAVSRKRHTTRTGVLATHTKGDSQLVFIDTPGFIQCKSKKAEGMFGDLIKGATDGMDHADYTLVVIDAARKIEDDLREELAMLMIAAHHARGRVEDVTVGDDGKILDVIHSRGNVAHEKFAIVLNKVDLVNPKELLLDIAEDIGMLGDSCVRYRGESISNEDELVAANQETVFTQEEKSILEAKYPPVFFISALKNDGINDVLEHLFSLCTPTREFVLPPGKTIAMSLAERVEEIIREKIYRSLHREIPHSVTQVNRALKKMKAKDGRIVLRIDQDLVVRTKSHYNIVNGRGRMTLKRIHDAAKRDLLKILRSEGYDDIALNLHVKLSTSNSHDRELQSERQGVSITHFD